MGVRRIIVIGRGMLVVTLLSLGVAWMCGERTIALNDMGLARIRGGAVLCHPDCLSSGCKCGTSTCKDIGCSPCNTGGAMGSCQGVSTNESDVQQCYESSSATDSCKSGANQATDCKLYIWDSSTNCTGTARNDPIGMYANSCS